nr:hypothetical protein [Tanacetum cinerariifolium]
VLDLCGVSDGMVVGSGGLWWSGRKTRESRGYRLAGKADE